MKINELRKKTNRELREIILSCRRELMDFRFKVTTKQLKVTSNFKKTRQIISRSKTILSERT